MCKVNGHGTLKFGIKEWMGIAVCMVAVAGATSAVNYALITSHHHRSDMLEIVDREIGHHVAGGPHEGVIDQLRQFSTENAQDHAEILVMIARIEEHLK